MTPAARQEDWKTRTMSNLRAADELWAYNIRAHDEFRLLEANEYGPVNDAVLLRLFKLGLYDWKGLDERSADETEVMRLSSTMAMRMMQRILLCEKQVDLLISQPLLVSDIGYLRIVTKPSRWTPYSRAALKRRNVCCSITRR